MVEFRFNWRWWWVIGDVVVAGYMRLFSTTTWDLPAITSTVLLICAGYWLGWLANERNRR